MRKGFIPALVAIIAASITALTVGTGTALAANCPGGGYANVQVLPPSVGQEVDVSINATAASYQNGDFRSFSQVFITGGHSIEVGLISDGSGLQQYIESGGVFLYKADANKFTQYGTAIARTGTNTFVVNTGGGSGNHTITVPSGNTYASTVFESVDNQASGTCNTYAFSYSSESPFNLKCANTCATAVSPSTWPPVENLTTSSFNTISGP